MPNNFSNESYPVKSVGRAMELLEEVARAGESGMSLTELSQAIGMAKSSTSAAARTLAMFGMLHVEQPGPRYHLGFGLLRFGDLVSQHISLAKIALPFLHELTEKSGLTARFAINEGGYPVFIERVDGRGAVRFHTPLGQREQPHATAAGKVMLANMSANDVERILSSTGLPRYTAATITSRTEFDAELERVRMVGFAIDNEEESEGILCVGAPLFDHHRVCAGAISVTGLKADLPDSAVGALGALVREHALRISTIMSGGHL
jgi:IclR family acetate operon transcriptional repressor